MEDAVDVEFDQREGSAWRNVYRENGTVAITNGDILASNDGLGLPKNTLASGLDEVNRKWRNTFSLLRNA